MNDLGHSMMRALCATLGSEGARKAQAKLASEERAIDADTAERVAPKRAKCACDLFSDCAKHASKSPWA